MKRYPNRLTIPLDERTKEWLKNESIKQDLSMSHVARRALLKLVTDGKGRSS